MDDVLIELDDDRRASLERVGRAEHRLYLARQDPDGTITLTPAVVMSEIEARFLANPTLMQQLDDDWEHPERLIPWRMVTEPADDAQSVEASSSS